MSSILGMLEGLSKPVKKPSRLKLVFVPFELFANHTVLSVKSLQFSILSFVSILSSPLQPVEKPEVPNESKFLFTPCKNEMFGWWIRNIDNISV